MTDRRVPGAVYVAYRREDAEAVHRLIAALQDTLGPHPDWTERWFFVDTRVLGSGDLWLMDLSEAHRSAACVLGVMSNRTMPRSAEDGAKHAIYLDELIRALSMQRLHSVRLDPQMDDLPLGLGQAQHEYWNGEDTSVLASIADRIWRQADRVATGLRNPNIDGGRRSTYLAFRRDLSVSDQLVDVPGVDPPTIIRPVPRSETLQQCSITTRPVSRGGRTLLGPEEAMETARGAGNADVPLRPLWTPELYETVIAPEGARDDWHNPFDLAVRTAGAPYWTIDVDGSLAAITPDGRRVGTTPSTKAELWLSN